MALFQGDTISHKSPLFIDNVGTNFGQLYAVPNGTNGTGNGTNVFVDSVFNNFTGLSGSTVVIPSLNLQLIISSVTDSSTVVLSGTVPTMTGLTWFIATTLSNLELGAVSMNVKFLNAGSWEDESGIVHTFSAGDYAYTCDTLTSLGDMLSAGPPPIIGVWCSLWTDQSTPVASIAEGLPGLYPNGIQYEMSVWHNKIISGILQAPRIVGVKTFTVYQPQV